MKRLKHKPKYKIGQTVYIMSRYDGVVERVITGIKKVYYEKSDRKYQPLSKTYYFGYSFDKLVPYHKEGDCLGAKNDNTIIRYEYAKSKDKIRQRESIRKIKCSENKKRKFQIYHYHTYAHLCPENQITLLGETIKETHPIKIGKIGKILTKEMINYDEENYRDIIDFIKRK